MDRVKEHYDDFLGPVYSWILGDFETAYKKNVNLFGVLKLAPSRGDVAIDLGSGPGCQSIPLAELGFEVVAVDFCKELLDEISQHAGKHSIATVCGDIVEFTADIATKPQLIVCMGDTLVHLPGTDTVNQLLANVASALAPGGRFIYSMRDYTGPDPEGANRFIPVRASDEQIFICFLDYKDDVVHVHDVLHRKDDGAWKMQISDYLKLRLDSAAVNDELGRNGLEVISQQTSHGMIVVMAEKPA